jgi:hypothetical protein
MAALTSIRAGAATITVSNTGTDTPNCGAAGSPCKTIKHALALASSNDTILVEGQYAESLTVAKSVTITGVRGNASRIGLGIPPTAVIDGVGTDRVFTINSGVTVTMSNLTIQNAKSTADGAAIANLGTLIMSNSKIQNNSLGKFGHEKCQPCEGGGISNQGTMTLTNVRVSGNSANGGGSGGILIFSHPADLGGGIYNSGTLTVADSTIESNIAGSSGGGIFNAIGGKVRISNSTISKNTASTGGGIPNVDELTVTNSTIGQNKGGGVFNPACGSQVNTKAIATQLTYTTVANNDVGLTNLPTAVINAELATRSETSCTQSMTVRGSIVASSKAANCATNASGSSSVTSEDYNLDSGVTCGFHQPHDLSSTNPLLGPLASNAPGPVMVGAPVPTETYALLVGSPAIDAGGTSANGCPAADQRGVSRPQGRACDIGAYERIP